MKTLQQVMTKTEISSFKKGLIATASFYKEFKAKIESDSVLCRYFFEHTPKEIYSELFSEEEQKKHPLYVEGKKQSICVAIDNVKKEAKKLIIGDSKKEEKKEDKKEEKKKEEPKLKELNQIVSELQYIRNNAKKFKDNDLKAILSAIKMVSDELEKYNKK